MASGATVGEARADREIGLDVAGSVAGARPLALGAGELALEELASTADGPERVAADDECGRVGDEESPTTRSDFLGQGLVDSFSGRVGRRCLVDELSVRDTG